MSMLAGVVMLTLAMATTPAPANGEMVNVKWINRLAPLGSPPKADEIIFIKLKPAEVTANSPKHTVHTHTFGYKNTWENVLNLGPGVEHDIQMVKGETTEWRFSPQAFYSLHIPGRASVLCDWRPSPQPHFPQCVLTLV